MELKAEPASRSSVRRRHQPGAFIAGKGRAGDDSLTLMTVLLTFNPLLHSQRLKHSIHRVRIKTGLELGKEFTGNRWNIRYTSHR